MNYITKENAGRNVYEEGYTTVLETALVKGSDTKLKVEFDWSGMDAMKVLIPAAKDLLSDFNNNRRAAVKRASEGDNPVELDPVEAARDAALYDEARDVYIIKAVDTFKRVRSVGVTKSVTAQAEAMSPEKLAETIAQLQALLEKKQS